VLELRIRAPRLLEKARLDRFGHVGAHGIASSAARSRVEGSTSSAR
jgi:hypothetical protein